HALPGQLVIQVALEGVRTISRQRAVIRLAIGAKVVEWLVKSAGGVRRVTSCCAAIGLFGGGQAGVVAPESAPGIAEHTRPAVARTLGQTELYTVVVADRQGLVRAGRTCSERIEWVRIERKIRNAVCRSERG